jgi:hypothetical protein
VVLKVKPTLGAIADKTLSPSATTSTPMPSPGITANLMLLAMQ